ncbi:hypothetical protein [Microbacterium foliorum]|uniref:hypothetical protein n=1 Tax=Microbacterium foliorum TaxID=104336 RepID=UPI00099FD8DF|nr:hypothetical protein [Microbacterium foliorum]AQY01866.1 hypothetical protein B2G67_10615 [Microbacterium foliorum]
MSNDERNLRSAFDGFGGELLGSVRGMAKGHVDQAFSEGFDAAASLCVNLVAKTIADLMAKISSGVLLSNDEQILAGKLTDLKAEMEQQLRALKLPMVE